MSNMMSEHTADHVHQGLLNSSQIEDLVSQLVAEEISIHHQNQKLKEAQARAREEERQRIEAERRAIPLMLSASGDEVFCEEEFSCYQDTDQIDGLNSHSSNSQQLGDATLKERLHAFTKGVRETLTERISQKASKMMSDMPVIERADGTVGDIGETWWSEQHGAQSGELPGATEAQMRSVTIAKRLNSFEEKPFDINQEVAGFNEGSWDDALAAMEKNVVEDLALTMGDIMSATRSDMQGAKLEEAEEFDWIEMDEIDGLEQATEFLAFRVPGGHPEVQDTGSYVNYLVQDELSESANPLVKKHAASHLRVIEGGSGRIRKAI